ncbi:ngrB, partial [Escherichia coli TW15901]
TWYCG